MKPRPRLKREVKKPFSFSIKPSIVVGASKKAVKNDKSLSEVVSQLLYDYSAE